MALRQLVAAVALLGLVAVAAANDICESSSVMFGSPWKPNNPYYIQESAWKTHGSMTKVNVYFNDKTGCLMGIKPTYGWQSFNARRLGVEKIGEAPLPSKDLTLQKGEFINKANYKFGSCITYLSLQTNMGRELSVGRLGASGPLQTSQPEWADGFLAYFKAYTDGPNTAANVGKLEQLQLVWASKGCGSSPKLAVVDRDATVKRMQQQPQAAQAAQEKVQEVPPEDIQQIEVEEPAAAAAVTATPAAVGAVSAEPAAGTAAQAATEEIIIIEELPPESVTAAPSAALAVEAEIEVETPTPEPTVTVDANGKPPERPARPIKATVQPKPAANASVITTTTTVTVTPVTATTTSSAVCSGGIACSDGQCATSSCALNGMGKDVLTMMCFGTNILPNIFPNTMLDLTTGNPCTNLACKLDKANCTTTTLGWSKYCTGKVVAMGATAKLHPSGKAFVGYPCIEHRGPVVDLVPVGDYTAKGTYIAKAWKVCDCINGLGLKDGSIAFKVPGTNGGSLTIIPPKIQTLPHFPFLNRELINMSLPDVVAQWVAANVADAPVPRLSVSAHETQQLKSFLPNFTLPSMVVPKVSVPLLKLPTNFSLPVFVLPIGNRTLQRVTNIMPNITSLPTLIFPSWKELRSLPRLQLQLPEVTISNLDDWANSFGVPTMPKLPPVFNMTFQDAVTQWVAANSFSLTIPKLQIPDILVTPLQALIPDFTVPSLVVTELSAPLMHLPSPFPVPVINIPQDEEVLKVISELVPKISSLPSYLVPPTMPLGHPRLPQLSLPNITVPNFEEVVVALGASLPKWPKLPTLVGPQLPTNISLSLPSLNVSRPSLKVPDLSGIVTAVSNLPDLNITWRQWPAVLEAWGQNYITKPPEFDTDGLVNMLHSNEALISNALDGFEVSFEVPNALAQWIAGVVQHTPLPHINITTSAAAGLQEILPAMPHNTPSLVVTNSSAPYFNKPEEAKAVPTVIVPDSLIPQVRHFLPNLTNIPTLVVPQLPKTLPEIPAIPEVVFQLTLPDVTVPSFLESISTMVSGLHTAGVKSGAAATEGPVAVAVGQATAAPAPAAAASTVQVAVEGNTTAQSAPPAAEPVVAEVTVAADGAAVAAEADGAVSVTADVAASTESDAAAAKASKGDGAAKGSKGSKAEGKPKPEGQASQPAAAAAAAAATTTVTAGAAVPPAPAVPAAGEATVTEVEVDQLLDDGSDPESAMVTDGEGAMIMAGPGPETAFMDPAEFFALDKETQEAFRAIFVS